MISVVLLLTIIPSNVPLMLALFLMLIATIISYMLYLAGKSLLLVYGFVATLIIYSYALVYFYL
jgi:hypothetical protein